MARAPLERTELTIGIVALTDSAPLVIALEKGFFAAEGLTVTLSRHASWAAIRDRLAVGALDAAQLLAAMPLALSLGLEALEVPVMTAFCLGLGGGAITVSAPLYRRMLEADPEAMTQAPVSARALKRVLERGRAEGRPPPVFAMVYPFSEHHYLLRHWLAAAAIDPDAEVGLTVVPPPQMVTAFQSGQIDGCCVGEPWNTRAVRAGLGHLLVTDREIVPHPPGKVLGVTRAWAERHPASHRALIRALTDAARWLDRPENRLEAARILGGPDYLDLPFEVVALSLSGVCQRHPGQAPQPMPDFHVFHRDHATLPRRGHALWLLRQMLRWGQVPAETDLRRAARTVYCPALAREAAAAE